MNLDALPLNELGLCNLHVLFKATQMEAIKTVELKYSLPVIQTQGVRPIDTFPKNNSTGETRPHNVYEGMQRKHETSYGVISYGVPPF